MNKSQAEEVLGLSRVELSKLESAEQIKLVRERYLRLARRFPAVEFPDRANQIKKAYDLLSSPAQEFVSLINERTFNLADLFEGKDLVASFSAKAESPLRVFDQVMIEYCFRRFKERTSTSLAFKLIEPLMRTHPELIFTTGLGGLVEGLMGVMGEVDDDDDDDDDDF